jgi:hypothetical protein
MKMEIDQQTTPEKKPEPQPTITPTQTVLKIDTTLYCLDTGTIKYLFTTEDEAITYLKTLDKKDINPDNSQIVQILATGNTWKLTPVPWSRIALKLL